MYGKGRVYYSTLGHQTENWNNPQIQKMYAEAIASVNLIWPLLIFSFGPTLW
jgi:type 1 glutamine amidotransferase